MDLQNERGKTYYEILLREFLLKVSRKSLVDLAKRSKYVFAFLTEVLLLNLV